MTPIEKISKEELKELYEKDFPLWAEINYQLLKEKAYVACSARGQEKSYVLETIQGTERKGGIS